MDRQALDFAKNAGQPGVSNPSGLTLHLDLRHGERTSLADVACHAGKRVIAGLPANERRALGQFMTPPVVANFMAKRALPPEDLEVVRVLDPAAGTGILVAAVVDAALARVVVPDRIEVTLYEVDRRLVPVLQRLVRHLRVAAIRRGVTLRARIHCADFLLSHAALEPKPVADVIIANPPYFKLNGRDFRARVHAAIVHGQPNIYALFMAVCAKLVNPGGRWCFITPRSWTNGKYFSATRRALTDVLSFDAMHLFESRRDHFADDEILQEAMITWATVQARPPASIAMSCSNGAADMASCALIQQPAERIVGADHSRTITLPNASDDTPWRTWTATLETYGLKVSTGPVVAFRAARHLREAAAPQTVPLLWMQHIRPMQIQWPIQKKREYMVASGETAWMLVPNSTIVVMRRFSPKEDYRRVIAAPHLAGDLPGAMLGLENHTNYIYRPGGVLDTEEALGLAALLNSAALDAYLRAVAGNTQINASDLRQMPLPSMSVIRAIGRQIQPGARLADVDRAVDTALNRATARHAA